MRKMNSMLLMTKVRHTHMEDTTFLNKGKISEQEALR